MTGAKVPHPSGVAVLCPKCQTGLVTRFKNFRHCGRRWPTDEHRAGKGAEPVATQQHAQLGTLEVKW